MLTALGIELVSEPRPCSVTCRVPALRLGGRAWPLSSVMTRSPLHTDMLMTRASHCNCTRMHTALCLWLESAARRVSVTCDMCALRLGGWTWSLRSVTTRSPVHTDMLLTARPRVPSTGMAPKKTRKTKRKHARQPGERPTASRAAPRPSRRSSSGSSEQSESERSKSARLSGQYLSPV